MASQIELAVARDLAITKHRRGTPERIAAERRVAEAEARFDRSAKTGTTPVATKIHRNADDADSRIKAIRSSAGRVERRRGGHLRFVK